MSHYYSHMLPTSAKEPLDAAIKHDTDKDPWHLLPWDAVRCILKVLAFGARKYDDRNWEKGMDWSRCFSACQRHLVSWFHGEGKDPESGYSHLWHAGCCILFLITYELRGIGTDDRPPALSPDAPEEETKNA
jgi:Domain of unknown function (DUF5664)